MSETVEVLFGANIAGLVAGVEGVKGELQGVADFTNGLASTFTEFGEIVMAAFAVEGIKSWTESIVEAGTDLNRMEAQLGMTAQQINVLRFAAEGSDTQLSMVVRSMTQFDRIASEATDSTAKSAKAFELLGINAKEYLATGHSLADLFQLTTQRLGQYSDSQEKGAITSALFGGRNAQLTLVLDKLGRSYGDLDAATTRSGITVEGFERSAQDTKEKMVEMGGATSGLAERMFLNLKPAIDSVVSGFTHLIEKMNQANDKANEEGVGQYFKNAANDVKTLEVVFSTALDIIWNTTVTVFTSVATYIKNTMNEISDFVALGWDALVHHHKIDMAKINQEQADYVITNKSLWKNNADYAVDAWKKAAAEIAKLQSGEGEKNIPVPGKKPPTPGNDPGIIDANKAKSDMKVWEDALTEMLLKKQEFGDAALQDELKFWQEKLLIAKKGTDDYSAIEKKVYDAEKQINSERTREAEKTEKEQEQTYDRFFQSFNSGIMGMLKGTQTFRQAMQETAQHVLENWLKTIEKILAHWIATENAKTTATVVGNAARTTSDKAAAAASSKGFGDSAIGQIQGDAAKAYGGVYGFLAPEIGPLAAVPAAAAYVAVIGMESLIPSFDVGTWNVPHDMTANLHAGERVLTASENLYGTGGGGSGGVTLQINGGINDAKSIRDLIMREGPALKKSMQRQAALSHSKAIK